MKKILVACGAAFLLLISATACRACVSSSETDSREIPAFTIPSDILGEESPLVPDTVNVDQYAIPESESLQFVKNLRLGWNLGNAFDASDCGNTLSDLAYESAWCGCETTIEDIAAVKAAGFQTVRIPVSWHNHVDENDWVRPEWMDRVKEVVDWCRACDLYVILNTHHDIAEAYYYPDSAHLERSKQYLEAVWEQLAEAFAAYDEHVLFESMNEPRLTNTAYEWSLVQENAACRDAVACINQLNQLFVDTVRAAGGNNATRYLMCPGYAASVEGCMHDEFVLPKDAANRIIVSVHAYTPYSFALDQRGTDAFDCDNPSDVNSITSFMDHLYGKFVMNRIPVVIGEVGALDKENLAQRVEFAAVYTAAARKHGITCCWWDNNAFSGSGENFGLLYRKTARFLHPEIVQAMNKFAQ